MATMSTSINNVYSIMNERSAAFLNTDTRRPITVGPELQKGVQDTLKAAEKGTTENYVKELYKINIRV